MKKCCAFMMLIGRLLIAPIFLLAGIGKFLDYEGTVNYMASKNMTMIPLFLWAAAIIEVVGGLSILLGWKIRWGAGMLFLYLIPVTCIFHAFWALPEEMQKMEMIHFFMNLAVMGGLLYVVCGGAGACCCDRCRSDSCKAE